MTVEQVADALETIAREMAGDDFAPEAFYVGIGKDMDERASWHRTDNLFCIRTMSREMAGAVETEMYNRGYDTGRRPDNGGDDESVFVYIYPITEETRETAEED